MSKLENLVIGRTTVKVLKRDENNNVPHELHRGVVVQDLGAFLRVFNPSNPDQGGDYDPLCSELFPVSSKRVFIEKTGELKENQAIKIPVQFNC